jgi:hypothetical protein
MLTKVMATRKPVDTTGNVIETTTEFHMHKSQKSMFNGIQHRVIDYTEHRLIRYAKTVKDKQQQYVLLELIQSYKAGKVAIAWKRGLPVWIPVTKDM